MKLQKASCRLAVVVYGFALCSTPSVLADEEVDYQPFSLNAGAGTLGLGGTLSWRFSDHLGLSAGGNYFSRDHSDEVEGITYDATLKLQSFPIGVDLYTSKSSSFHVTLGALLNQNKLTGSTPLTTVDINGTSYVAALQLEIEQQEISPFISIGGTLFFDSKKHVGLGFELGVAYTGSPTATLTQTATSGPIPNLAENIAAEEQQLEDSANDYKFYPIIKVGVTISF
jgi:hypothetical protein